MIVLIGESGAGKSTVQKELEKMGIRKVVTCTTRPMRPGEVNGVDYNFISEDEFARMAEAGEFAEFASYRNWRYGTPKEACGKPDTCAALTPAGLRALKRAEIPCLSFYLDVDRRSRLIAILKRGDDIEEAYRRSLSDLGQFDAIRFEADITIENQKYQMPAQTLADFIYSTYEDAKKYMY